MTFNFRPLAQRIKSLFLLFIALAMCGAPSSNEIKGLEFVEVKSLECSPVKYNHPLFQATLSIGRPIDPQQLKMSFTGAGKVWQPFFLESQDSSSNRSKRKKIVLILMDVSGSMGDRNISRFRAAKASARQFLREGFRENVDQIAIVPFGSHSVSANFSKVKFFKSYREYLQRVDSIPDPKAADNTALYASIQLGIRSLQDRLDPSDPADVLLVVLTDGKNEILPGDDPDLFNAQYNLANTQRMMRDSQVPVSIIAFSVSPADRPQIAQISSNVRFVTSEAELSNMFSETQKFLTNRFRVSLRALEGSVSELSGREIPVAARLEANKEEFSASGRWSGSAIGPQSVSIACSDAERSALAEQLASEIEISQGIDRFRSLIISFLLAVILALAWFLVPSLVWPDDDKFFVSGQESKGFSGRNWSGGRQSSSGTYRGTESGTNITPKD